MERTERRGDKSSGEAAIAVGLRVRNVKNNRKGTVSEMEDGGDQFKIKFDDGDEHWRPVMNFEAEDGRSLTYSKAKPSKDDEKSDKGSGSKDEKKDAKKDSEDEKDEKKSEKGGDKESKDGDG